MGSDPNTYEVEFRFISPGDEAAGLSEPEARFFALESGVGPGDFQGFLLDPTAVQGVAVGAAGALQHDVGI